MRLGHALLLLVPSLVACKAPDGPLGTVEEAITICPGATTLKGIDVAHYDGTIDWAQVKASGRAFAFAKATEGTTNVDSQFATNWPAMQQHGVVRSAYHFFHANMDPVTQANHFLSVMGTLAAGDLPPTLDLEVTDNEAAATITANMITWLDAVAAATGTKPILYSSPSFIGGTLGSPAGLEQHATLWVANWGVSCPDVPSPFTAFAFWQTSSTGTVPGVSGSGNVDLDEFNGDMAALNTLSVGGSSGTSTSSSTSSSASSGSPPPTCQVMGVSGVCVDVSLCASMPGYTSTPGYCPGPVTEQCCTKAGTSSSSGGSGTGGAPVGTGGAPTSTSGSAATGAQGANGNNMSSSCTAAPTSDGARSTARTWLAALALAELARRPWRRQRRRGRVALNPTRRERTCEHGGRQPRC
jgi:lysozyme